MMKLLVMMQMRKLVCMRKMKIWVAMEQEMNEEEYTTASEDEKNLNLRNLT